MNILKSPLRPASSHSVFEVPRPTGNSQSLLQSARQLEEAGAIAAARSAWSAATEADDTPRSSIEFAGFLVRTRCHAEAQDVYNTLLKDVRVLASDHLRGVVRHNLAAALRETGDSARAASLQQMANRDRLLADGELSATELTASSLDALAVQDLKTAQELLQRAVLLERQCGDRSAEAADCGNLATIAIYRGELSAAASFLIRAWHLYQETGNWYSAARSLLTLSDVLVDLHRPRFAMRCLNRAGTLFDRAGATEEGQHVSDQTARLQQTLEISRSNPLLN